MIIHCAMGPGIPADIDDLQGPQIWNFYFLNGDRDSKPGLECITIAPVQKYHKPWTILVRITEKFVVLWILLLNVDILLV